MTREEAIEIFENKENYVGIQHIPGADVYISRGLAEAINVALTALRPVSREKVFPGCDFCKIELDDYPYIVAHSDYSLSDTCYEPSFCPICGKPLTDEAVQMVMERLEALFGERNDD